MALYYARTGNRTKAQSLLDWLDARLYEPGQGLYRDGLRISGTGDAVLEETIYTYNQGPVLGALLELGGEPNLGRAAALVDAVARNLTQPAPLLGRTAAVLRCEGTGDGGLFTGILVRYLALAAVDERLPAETRATAAALVNDTAEALWEGRRILPPHDRLARRGSHPGLLRPHRNAGTAQLPGRCRRRTLHAAAGLDGAGGGRLDRAGAGPTTRRQLRHAIVS